MQEARTRNQNKEKPFFISFHIYKYYKGNLKESGIKQKPAFIHQGVYYFTFSFAIQSATVKVPDTFKIQGNRTINAKDTLKKDNINKRL